MFEIKNELFTKEFIREVKKENILEASKKLKSDYFSLDEDQKEYMVKGYKSLIEGASILNGMNEIYPNNRNIKIEIDSYELYKELLEVNGLGNYYYEVALDDLKRLVLAKNRNEPIRYSKDNIYYGEFKNEFKDFSLDKFLDKYSVEKWDTFGKINENITLESAIGKEFKEIFLGDYYKITCRFNIPNVEFWPELKHLNAPNLTLNLIESHTNCLFSDSISSYGTNEEHLIYFNSKNDDYINLIFYVVAKVLKNIC